MYDFLSFLHLYLSPPLQLTATTSLSDICSNCNRFTVGSLEILNLISLKISVDGIQGIYKSPKVTCKILYMHFSAEQLYSFCLSQEAGTQKKSRIPVLFLPDTVLLCIASKVVVLKSLLAIHYRLSYDGSIFLLLSHLNSKDSSI